MFSFGLGFGLDYARMVESAPPAPPVPPGNAAIQSDDGNWYQLAGDELSAGNALLILDQNVASPGANVYRVILNSDDGLKYKLFARGSPPNVEWAIDPAPTLEAATPTAIEVNSVNYNVVIVNDPAPIPILVPV